MATEVETRSADPWQDLDVAEEATPTPAKTAPRAARAPQVADRKKSGSKIWVALALSILLIGGGGIAAYKLLFETKDGTLVVEVDGDADVRFQKGELRVYDTDGKLKYTLKPSEKNKSLALGKYRVEVTGADGLKLETDTFEITRNGQATVHVTVDATAVAKKGPDLNSTRGEYALLCEGGRECVKLPNVGLDLSKSFTIEAHLNQNRDLSVPGLSPAVIYAFNRVALVNGDRWKFMLIGPNDGSYVHKIESGPIVNGKWAHVACVVTGKQMRLFVNGVLVGDKDTTQEPPAPIRTDLNIGFDFDGFVTEVRISKKARYEKQFTPAMRFETDPETVALYHFDEGKGDILKDSSGHGRHGKIGAAKWAPTKAVQPNDASDDVAAPIVVVKPAEIMSLDKLDPAQIPAAERYPWQPKELVAVVGEHRGRCPGGAFQVLYSPNGQTIATTSYGKCFLWDAATLRIRAVVPGAADVIAFAPDGTLACYQSAGGNTVQLWDLSGPELKRAAVIEAAASNTGLALAFAPKGKTLAVPTQADYKVLQILDLSDAKPVVKAILKGSNEQVGAALFSTDGKTVAATPYSKNKVYLWDLNSPEPKVRAELAVEGNIAFIRDGTTLATGGPGKVSLWDLTEEKPRERTAIPNASGYFAVSADGKTFACESDGVCLFDVSGAEPVKLSVIKGTSGPMAFSPDGKSLVTAGREGVLRLWDLGGAEPKERLTPQGHIGALKKAELAPDGKTLATFVEREKLVRLWDMSGAAPRECTFIPVAPPGVDSAAFAPDGKTLAISSLGYPAMVQLWDLTRAEPAERSRFRVGGGASSLNFLPDGKSLAMYNKHHEYQSIQLWDVAPEEPKERATLPFTALPYAISPDGKTLASVIRNRGDTFELWDLTRTRPKAGAVFNPSYPNYNVVSPQLSWTPDGKTLAVSLARAGAQAVQFWDVSGAKPKERDLFEENSWFANNSMSFAPNGKTLACSIGNTVVVWNMKSKVPRKWEFPMGVAQVAFAPDGRHLITANTNGTAYVLRLEPAPGESVPVQSSVDPDRKAAEYVLSIGGTVHISGGGEIKIVADLPRTPFLLSKVELHVPVPGLDLRLLGQLSALKTINLYSSGATDADLKNLRECVHLESLQLMGTAVTDNGLEHLQKMTELQALDLYWLTLTDAGIEKLLGLKKLKHLNLMDTKVSDRGVEKLKQLTNLEGLWLTCCSKVTDAGLVHIAAMKGLKNLGVGPTVTDAGLEHLKDMMQLQWLKLGSAAITDSGLEKLKGLTNLTKLTLEGTRVTAAKIDELKKALPKCTIEWNSGVIEPAAAPDSPK